MGVFVGGRDADEVCIGGRQWEEREGEEECCGGGCVLQLQLQCRGVARMRRLETGAATKLVK